MEDYINSKLMLFNQLDDNGSFAIINTDDVVSERIIKNIKRNYFSYSVAKKSDIYPIYYEINFNGIRLTANTPKGEIKINSKLIGSFNIYNILASIGIGIGLDIDSDAIKRGIELIENVPGRAEKLELGQKYNIIIDYSHTPDSLFNIISTMKRITKGRVIAVFGCGGDRDKGKRPIMGRIAQVNADITIITSDNPRTEDPNQIISDIVQGIKKKENIIQIPDRKKAIFKALSIAEESDSVLILGKGHETYQIIGNKKIHFNDKEVVTEFFKKERN
jgi:UDP-N-acetylmuramyl-tripeptide synthetase